MSQEAQQSKVRAPQIICPTRAGLVTGLVKNGQGPIFYIDMARLVKLGFGSAYKNSYYYHRQENKLSGTETDSRFFLARGRWPSSKKAS